MVRGIAMAPVDRASQVGRPTRAPGVHDDRTNLVELLGLIGGEYGGDGRSRSRSIRVWATDSAPKVNFRESGPAECSWDSPGVVPGGFLAAHEKIGRLASH
jgi:hypothetical protein